MPSPILETTDIDVLRTQFQAWMDGVNARFLGIVLAECPHAYRSAAGDAWDNGWHVCNSRLYDMKILERSERERPPFRVGDSVTPTRKTCEFIGLKYDIVYRVAVVVRDYLTSSHWRVVVDGGFARGYDSGWFKKL